MVLEKNFIDFTNKFVVFTNGFELFAKEFVLFTKILYNNIYLNIGSYASY